MNIQFWADMVGLIVGATCMFYLARLIVELYKSEKGCEDDYSYI